MGAGRLWLVVVGCGRLWWVVVGCGVLLVGCGVLLVGCGRLVVGWWSFDGRLMVGSGRLTYWLRLVFAQRSSCVIGNVVLLVELI